MSRKIFYSITFQKWIDDLMSVGILRMTYENNTKVIYLATPFLIRLKKSVIKKLREEYNPKVEKGGILLGKPLVENDKQIIEICDVLFIKNDSDNPQHSYRYNNNDFIASLSYSFLRRNRKLIYYPIFFHTHPTFDYNESSQIMKYFQQAGTSYADQKYSKMIITEKAMNLALPNALIVGGKDLHEHLFIGFYGGYIAPENFREYMTKLTGKTFRNIFETLKDWANTPEKQLILAIVGVALGVLSIRYIKHTLPLLMILFATNIVPISESSIQKTPIYFAEVKDSEITIQIPSYSIEKKINLQMQDTKTKSTQPD